MANSKISIPLNTPVLDGNEKKYLLDVLKSGWISFNGKYTREFEKQFAYYLKVKYALSCSSGSAALHLGLLALGIGVGDEVIIPDFTIITSANSVIMCGAKPVLVDVDKFFCLDPEKIEEKISKKTKAIMVVHMYGNPANMEKIMQIAKKHKLFVIEDACDAHGAQTFGKKVGTMGDIGCFSFYSTKIITGGEGGMVVTNNKKLAKKVLGLRDYGHSKPRFVHKVLGFNYRISDLQSAICLAQLEKIDQKIKRKREIAQIYTNLLKSIGGIILPGDPPWGKSIFWMYGILIESFGLNRDQIIKGLARNRIDTSPFFVPMNKQPVFKKKDPRYPNISDDYPISSKISKIGLLLPSGLNISQNQQKAVASTLLSLKVKK